MSDLSIEYSLNTSVLSEKNILNYNLNILTKHNNIKGGGFHMSNSILLLISIIIIIIGLVLLCFKNNWVETEAIIKTKSCIESNNKCKINITYIVNSTEYSKIITIEKNNIPDTSTIKIYYQETNPKLVQLYNSNNKIISISMIIVGALIMIFSLSNNNISNSDASILSDDKMNL